MAASRHERRWAAGHFGGVGPTIPVFEKFEGRQVLLVDRWEFFTQKPLLPREARKIHYRGFEFCEFGRVWGCAVVFFAEVSGGKHFSAGGKTATKKPLFPREARRIYYRG